MFDFPDCLDKYFRIISFFSCCIQKLHYHNSTYLLCNLFTYAHHWSFYRIVSQTILFASIVASTRLESFRCKTRNLIYANVFPDFTRPWIKRRLMILLSRLRSFLTSEWDGKNTWSSIVKVARDWTRSVLRLGDSTVLHLIRSWDRFSTAPVTSAMEARYFLSTSHRGGR